MKVLATSSENTLLPPSNLPKIASSAIGSGAINNKSLRYNTKLSAAEKDGIAKGTHGIYVFGRVEYKDAFGKPRFTNYRLKYQGIYPPTAGHNLGYCEHGNEAD